MHYKDFLKEWGSSFNSKLRKQIFISHLWIIHILEKPQQNKDDFFRDLFNLLNSLKINGLTSTALVIDQRIKKQIEDIYEKHFKSNITWINPIVDKEEDVNFEINNKKYLNSKIEKELFHIVALLIMKKQYKPFEINDIQFIKNILLTKKCGEAKEEIYNCYSYTSLMMSDADVMKNKMDKLMSNLDDLVEVQSIPQKTNALLGNGFTIAVSNRNSIKTMPWGGTLNSIQNNLREFYEIQIQFYTFQQKEIAKHADKKTLKKYNDELKGWKSRHKKYTEGSGLLKYILSIAITMSEMRDYIFDYLNGGVGIISNKKEDFSKLEKWLKNKMELPDCFYLREMTAFYILQFNDIEIWKGNFEIILLMVDKLKEGKKTHNIHNDIIYSFENQIFSFWQNVHDAKITEKISSNVSDVFTLNYDDFVPKMQKKCMHLHGSLNQTFLKSRDDKTPYKVINDDSFWRNFKADIYYQFDHSHSIIFKPADYKIRHIFDVIGSKLTKEERDKSFISNWDVFMESTSDILIFGTTLKYDLHVIELLNKDIKNVYVSYYSEEDKMNILRVLNMVKKMLNHTFEVFLIKSEIALKWLIE